MEKKLLGPHVGRFTDEMRVRNWSTGTIEQYVKALADFERFIVERYPRVGSVAGITDEMVSAYQLWLCQRENKRRGGTLAPATQRNARAGDAAHVPQRRAIVLRVLRH